MTDKVKKTGQIASLLAVVTLTGLVGGWFWGASAKASAITSNSATLVDHEKRIREVEKSATTVETDVKWIRETLKREFGQD